MRGSPFFIRHAWGFIALILLLASVGLTKWVTFVTKDNSVSEIPEVDIGIAVEKSARAADPAYVSFIRDGENFRIRVAISTVKDTSALVAVSNLAKAPACTLRSIFSAKPHRDGDLTYEPGGTFESRSDADPTDRRKEVLVTNVRVHVTKAEALGSSTKRVAVVICDLDVKPSNETFAGRAIRVSSMSPSDDKLSDYSAVDYTLDLHSMSNVDSFRLSGGSTTGVDIPDYGRKLTSDGDVVLVSWKDPWLQELHEIMLVAVGALLGLCAACALEWIRPAIVGRP